MASLAERFEAQVDRSDEHHRWLGAVNADRGTGRLKIAGRHVTAHRVAHLRPAIRGSLRRHDPGTFLSSAAIPLRQRDRLQVSSHEQGEPRAAARADVPRTA